MLLVLGVHHFNVIVSLNEPSLLLPPKWVSPLKINQRNNNITLRPQTTNCLPKISERVNFIKYLWENIFYEVS